MRGTVAVKRAYLGLVLILLVLAAVWPLRRYLGQKEPAPVQVARVQAQPIQLRFNRGQPHPLSLTLSPSQKSVKAGEEFTVSVMADAETGVLAIDLYLAYDPDTLTLTRVSPGDFFINPMTFARSTNPKVGKIFYALGSLTQSKPQGSVLDLTFQAKSSGKAGRVEAFVALEDKTLASARGAKKAEVAPFRAGKYEIE